MDMKILAQSEWKLHNIPINFDNTIQTRTNNSNNGKDGIQSHVFKLKNTAD